MPWNLFSMDAIHCVEAAYVYKKVLFTDYHQAALPQPTLEETKRENPESQFQMRSRLADEGRIVTRRVLQSSRPTSWPWCVDVY